MNIDPDWSLYRTLLAVLDDGSLSGAARRLGLTQPTVARHVEALESALGADLFVRSQRGLAPTDLARSLRPHAETIAASAAALLRIASGAAGEIAGTVRISASEVVGVEHLPPVLARLRRDHPRLVIELAVTDRVDDLLRRDADIAVRNTEPTQGALLARRLPAIDLGFHARREYLERRGTPTSIADLAGHDLIGFDTETPALRAALAHLPRLDRHSFALRTDSNLAQLAAIRAGFGIGLCQATLARTDPSLVRVLEDVTFPLPLWIAMHEDLKTSARFRLVFDTLVEALRGVAWRARAARTRFDHFESGTIPGSLSDAYSALPGQVPRHRTTSHDGRHGLPESLLDDRLPGHEALDDLCPASTPVARIPLARTLRPSL